MEDNNSIIFYTDGAYSPKNNQGGWALYCPQYRLRICCNETNTTNNRMEMMAVIKALEFVSDSNIPEKNITIISDSKYVVETMNGNYRKSTNLDLWDQLSDLVYGLVGKNISFQHIKGHTKNTSEEYKGNDIVDSLAVIASKL